MFSSGTSKNHTKENNINRSSSPSECPYAVALEENSEFEDSLLKCPAFAIKKKDGTNKIEASCPFKGADSPAAMQATWLSIPASHYQMTAFAKVLQHLHEHSSDISSFHVPGGCPVPPEVKSQMSFRQALEDLSLASVMATLVAHQDQEGHDHDSEEFDVPSPSNNGLNVSSFSSTSASSSFPTTATTSSKSTTEGSRASLSESLKVGTAVAHQTAEDVHFVRNFIKGEIDRKLYSKLVTDLYHVYNCLEEHLKQHAPDHFPSCHFPEALNRTAALREDLDFWEGTDNKNLDMSPATRDYVARLDTLAQTNPLMLLAHAYTRYLGDLSGGKVLSRVACRALNLDRHTMEGLAFYQFPNISSAKVFKDKYRRALDDLPLTSKQIEGLVAEANVAFLLNVRLFEELDVHANVPGAKVRSVEEALAYASPSLWKKSIESEDAECPFMVSKGKNIGSTKQSTGSTARCPWPFVLAHDPGQFIRDWQTWALVAVLLCVAWSRSVSVDMTAVNATIRDTVPEVALQMTAILGTMVAVLAGLVMLQTKASSGQSTFFPGIKTDPSKRAYELYAAAYTPVWIAIFGVVVVTQIYEHFTAWSYIQLCGGLALPFILQPILFPSAGFNSPDAQRSWHSRYSFKANLWIAVYSFIGNYWYTHYFYSVLKAKYTMPAHRLNNVPIAMYLATHFYFSTYHFFSNALLRKVVTTYQANYMRQILFVGVVVVFSYFTAFMETLTISSYPYYSFADRDMAYTVGSAFYGIYFLVSFPAFFYFDNKVDQGKGVSVLDTIVSSCGYGMIIMFILDFVRLYLDIPLVVGEL
jgi:cycloeucalenol cycloisomerase